MGKNMAIQNQRVKYADNIVAGESVVTGESIKNAIENSGNSTTLILSEGDWDELFDGNPYSVFEREASEFNVDPSKLFNSDAIILKTQDSPIFYKLYLEKVFYDNDGDLNKYFACYYNNESNVNMFRNRKLVIDLYDDGEEIWVELWIEDDLTYTQIELSDSNVEELNNEGVFSKSLDFSIYADILKVKFGTSGKIYYLTPIYSTNTDRNKSYRCINIPSNQYDTNNQPFVLQCDYDWDNNNLTFKYSNGFGLNGENEYYLGYDDHGIISLSQIPTAGKNFRYNSTYKQNYIRLFIVEKGRCYWTVADNNSTYKHCVAVVFSTASLSWASCSGKMTDLLTGTSYNNLATPTTSNVLQKIMLLDTDITITF